MTKREPIHRIARPLKLVIEQAVSSADSESSEGINLAGRSNVVVSHNTGGTGSVHHASASQSTRIVQHNGETQTDETDIKRSAGGGTDE